MMYNPQQLQNNCLHLNITGIAVLEFVLYYIPQFNSCGCMFSSAVFASVMVSIHYNKTIITIIVTVMFLAIITLYYMYV